MPFEKQTAYCPACQRVTVCKKHVTNTLVDGGLTTSPFGLSAPIWSLLRSVASNEPWKCTHCNSVVDVTWKKPSDISQL